MYDDCVASSDIRSHDRDLHRSCHESKRVGISADAALTVSSTILDSNSPSLAEIHA